MTSSPQPMLPILKRVGVLFRSILGSVPARIVIGFLSLVVVLDSLSPAPTLGNPTLAATWQAVLQTLVCIGALFGVYSLLVFLLEGRWVDELHWRAALPHLLAGLALGVFASGAHFVRLLTLATWQTVTVSVAGGYVLAAGVAAVSEELIFRGVLLRVSEEWLGTIGALLLSALFFSLAHAPELRGDTFIAGVALGSCFVLTRKLWLPIGGHFAHNALLDILSAGHRKELEAAGPDVWSVVLLGLPSAAIAIVFLIYAHRLGRVKKPAWMNRQMEPSQQPSTHR